MRTAPDSSIPLMSPPSPLIGTCTGPSRPPAWSMTKIDCVSTVTNESTSFQNGVTATNP